jgi:hypothetical protein
VSVRRCQPLADGVAAVARRLEHLETQVALLDRVRPVNLTSELTRLTRAFEAGQKLAPAFDYAARPALGAVRSELSSLATRLDQAEPEQRLLSERARELELEAALCEHVGEPAFDALARQRFPLPPAPSATRKLAELFLSAPRGPNDRESAGILHDSSDPRDPHSLRSQLSRLLDAERLPVRVEVVVGLVSLAAVASGAVRVRAGARLSEQTARRIALHEVEGHVRPRVNGQQLGGVFSAGSAHASQDEEGRAILLEERAGLLDAVGQRGATLPEAVELTSRVHRGGGLGRESIYLVGYQRVATALGRRPELEQVLRSGRVTLDAAEALLNGSIELDHDGNVV